MFCSNCGEVLIRSAKYCSRCGKAAEQKLSVQSASSKKAAYKTSLQPIQPHLLLPLFSVPRIQQNDQPEAPSLFKKSMFTNPKFIAADMSGINKASQIRPDKPAPIDSAYEGIFKANYEKQIYCTKCWYKLSERQKFCPKCGMKIRQKGRINKHAASYA